MSEEEIADLLDLVMKSIILVQERFSMIAQADDFVSTPDGVTILDAISMRLQVIGESAKRIRKKNPSLVNRYSAIEWDKIARFRDLVSHH